MNKNKKFLTLALFFSLISANYALGAEIPTSPGGDAAANGAGSYTLTPATITTVSVNNGAIVDTAGALTIKGKTNAYALTAQNGAVANVNGNLTANFGAGTSGGYSGIFALYGGKINLNGKENLITSDSTQDKNTKAAIQALQPNSVITVSGDVTKIRDGSGWVAGANRAITAGDGGKVVFSNGKSGAESSLVDIVSGRYSKRNIMATNNSSSVSATDAANHKYAGDSRFIDPINSQIIMDRVQIENSGNTRAMFTQGNGSLISILRQLLTKLRNTQVVLLRRLSVEK